MEIIKDNNRTIIIIPRNGNLFIILLTGCWFLFLLYGFYLQFSDGFLFIDTEAIILNLVFLVVGLIVLKTFLWHVRGKEKITLDSEILKIEKLGTFLTFPRKYETNLIDRFEIEQKEIGTWWSRLYGFSGGRIFFNYWENPKHFAQTISKLEAKELVEILMVALKATQNNDLDKS